MILFFQSPTKTVLAVEAAHAFSPEDVEKLVWAFSEAKPLQAETLEGWYVGPRREMITPVEYECRGNHPEHGTHRYITHRGILPSFFRRSRA